MNEAEKEIIHYFVDEAGDPALFNRKGQIIAGNEGCSSYFIIGKLEVDTPDELAGELEALRANLLADPYFKSVPSMQPERRKTAVAFHAKDDVAEVRREVYKLMLTQNIRFYAVVRDKRDLATYVKQQNEREPAYRYNENEQYDLLVTELFRKLHHMADEVNVCFSMRGTKPRNDAFAKALKRAGKKFKRSFGFKHPGINHIVSNTPAKSAGLQAVDYYLWALQRFYERGEDRFIEMIWHQVGEIHDLDRVEEGKRGVFYTKKKPLNSAAFEKK